MNYTKLLIAAGAAVVLIGVGVFFSKKCSTCCPLRASTEQLGSEQAASTEKNGVIAVVNLRKVAAESKAGISIERQISEINDAAKKELQEVESKMKAMEKDKLSESDSRKVEDMQFALYDMVRKKRNQISEAYKKAVCELESAMNSLLKQIAERGDVCMIINSDAVACASSSCCDVTGDVIKQMDETLPYIKVSIVQQLNGD